MKEIVLGKNDVGQRLDRFVAKVAPLLTSGQIQKYIRLKRIKINGKRAQMDTRLQLGDTLQLYINDELLENEPKENHFFANLKPQLNILYEDENIMLLDKRPGVVVHGDEEEKVKTLINYVQAYLYQKGEWNPNDENSFTPALCNRIDRNTGGIVIAAKNAETLRIMNDKIRNHEMQKKYLCICLGSLTPPKGKISCFLLKDEKKNMVSVYHKPVPGGKSADTLYETLQTKDGLSLVEVELLTGRTQQIRASFSDLGYPLLGDGKYGKGEMNRKYGEGKQALYSYSLCFRFSTDAGILEYLKGKTFKVTDIPFQKKYFPSST